MPIVTDSRAWRAAVDRWVVLAEEAGKLASHDAAEATRVATVILASFYVHPKGTKTPSPPGAPVGRISGNLVDSIVVKDDGDMSSSVGPTIRYGRVQELGGPTHGWWPGSLPERPYLKPATRALIDGGHIKSIYVKRWAYAQTLATGG